MVNTYLKGQRTVSKGIEILKKKGWVTDIVEKRGKFVKQKDLFGLFDTISIKPNRTKLIQFKTNRFPIIKNFKEFVVKYPQFEVEIWCWIDRKGFKIKKCNREKFIKL